MTKQWSQTTRDRWFFALLTAMALAVVALFWPFLDVIAYAAVVATVVSPVNDALTARLWGHRIAGAVATTALVAGLILWPLSLLLYRFALEGVGLARVGVEWVASGKLEVWFAEIRQWWEGDSMAALRAYVPEGTDPVATVLEASRSLLTGGLSAAGSVLPSLAEGLASGMLGLILFIFTIVTLLSEGPRLRVFLFRLTPLDDRYEARLVDVFREFATNVVVGAFVVAAAQGMVASLGYALMGVPRAMFFGVVTGLCGLVPIIGTAVVAAPIVVWTGTLYGWEWGVALALYSVVVIGGVDNLLRPLLIRGSTNVHPLLIFFAVFGGISWMGLSGALIGPVVVAGFLALATIFEEEFVASSVETETD